MQQRNSRKMISILFFPPVDIDKHQFHKMVFPLAKSNLFEVYVINRPADLFIDAIHGYKRLRKKFSITPPQSAKIKLIVPFVFFNEAIHESWCSWFNINMKMFIWQVRNLIKRESIDPAKLILWSYSPLHWKVMKEIPAKRKIYGVEDERCYDAKDRLKKRIYKAEKKMILYCDDIICASEKLRSKFEEISPRDRKIHLISVIADNSSFQKSNLTEYLRWDKIPAPKAVIFGKISHRINFDLIERLSMRIPDMSIVFIGKILDKRFKRLLRNYQNIYHLGFLSRDKIIYCLRSATVGLHPGKKLIFNEYSNPIRIYEYAAAGIPIVAINISRESDYPKTISVVDNDNGFITAVENRFKHGVTDNEKSELVKFSEKHSASEIVNAHIRVFQAAISA